MPPPSPNRTLALCPTPCINPTTAGCCQKHSSEMHGLDSVHLTCFALFYAVAGWIDWLVFTVPHGTAFRGTAGKSQLGPSYGLLGSCPWGLCRLPTPACCMTAPRWTGRQQPLVAAPVAALRQTMLGPVFQETGPWRAPPTRHSGWDLARTALSAKAGTTVRAAAYAARGG